jgi:single-strand DNA-binding protein
MERNIMSSIVVNKVILLGNAGQDAEARSTSAGKSVANFSLAINQSFDDKKEGNVQRVEWVRCVAWGKLAEIAERFVTKGKQVFVEGRLQMRRFDDREGSPKTVTEVVVASLCVLGGTPNASRNGNGQGAPATRVRGEVSVTGVTGCKRKAGAERGTWCVSQSARSV